MNSFAIVKSLSLSFEPKSLIPDCIKFGTAERPRGGRRVFPRQLLGWG